MSTWETFIEKEELRHPGGENARTRRQQPPVQGTLLNPVSFPNSRNRLLWLKVSALW